MQWEVVIGLETHAQLQTQSKIFSGASTRFGAQPNTQACAVDLALPGVLPVLNRQAVEHAIRFGLAVNAKISPASIFARKNYFYPDLPKGYQISQMEIPIVVGGQVEILVGDEVKVVQLTRAHMEEDAGKSVHEEGFTGPHGEPSSGIDLNRAGTPLLEIVTEPVMRSAAEAVAYAKALHGLVVWLGVCDGNMQEGSFRCDANVSVRPMGQAEFGTRCEIKNLNSFRFLEEAIQYEVRRQIELIEDGGTVVQETRLYDPDRGETRSMRSKEDANDYRYFPDPDLAPFVLTDSFIDSIQTTLPALPNQLKKDWSQQFGLNAYDIDQLCENKLEADFYLLWTKHTTLYKAAANWMIGPIRAYLNEEHKTYADLIPLLPQLSELLNMVDQHLLNFSVAADKVFNAIVLNAVSPMEFASSNQLLQNSNEDELTNWINIVLNNHPDKVEAYKKGKKGLIGLFVGEVKKISKGKSDPQKTTQLLEAILSK